MKRITIAFLFVATVLGFSSSARASDVVLATPNGMIVSGSTLGLEVGQVTPGLVVNRYVVPETAAASLPDPPARGVDPLLWGYEASSTVAQIFTYNLFVGSPPISQGPSCVPFGSQNGRGLAFDPMDGNLWYNFIDYPGFDGDGFIHKTTPPNTGSCVFVNQIPFGDGPGGTLQDDIGALDVDPQSKHIWAVGYKPVTVQGVERAYIYLVNRNNGSIIKSCWLPSRRAGYVGNDTLTVATLTGLSGSGEYLLTDAGGVNTVGNTLAAIDVLDCRNGSQVVPVAEFPKGNGMTGAEFESPGLLATDLTELDIYGDQPFSSYTSYGPFGNTSLMEDLSLCAYKTVFGGSDASCPY